MDNPEYIHLVGSYDRDNGADGYALSTSGTLTWNGNSLVLTGRVSRSAIRVILGLIGMIIGLFFIVGLAVCLESIDIDLLESRKGPVFVAGVAIVAMIVGYHGFAWCADYFFGKYVEWDVPVKDMRFGLWSKQGLTLFWKGDDPNSTRFYCKHRDIERLAQIAKHLVDAGATDIYGPKSQDNS